MSTPYPHLLTAELFETAVMFSYKDFMRLHTSFLDDYYWAVREMIAEDLKEDK